MSKNHRFETLALHAGQERPDPATGARAVPIYATTSFVFDSAAQAAGRFALTEGGSIYSRLGNPTNDVFETRMAALEGGVGAVSTASGAAAIAYAVQNIAVAGDHIVSSSCLYGGTYNFFAHTLRDQGVETTFVTGEDPADYAAALRENTKAVYLESMGNPNCNLPDLEGISAVAHSAGVPVIVDNTFASPYLFRPLEHGADIVVHSATKFIGGHGTVLGGVVVDGGTFDWSAGERFPGLSQPSPSYHGVVFTQACGAAAYIMKLRTTLLRDTGACLSPFHSFALLQGLETLALRMDRHVSNALRVVDWLKDHPKVRRVSHPSLAQGRQKELYQRYYPNGGGSIFSIELAGTQEQAQCFTESLGLFSLLANVADMKSLVIHPASTTHAQMSRAELAAAGITPTTVRLSIGTEHIDDILEDLDQALAAIQ